MSNSNEYTTIYNQFKKGETYLYSKNITQSAKTFREFWEGNHWGDHKISDILGIPEITVPVSQSIVGNKIANTLKDNTNIEFFTNASNSTGEGDKDDKINILQAFYDWVSNRMDLKTHRRAVVTSGAVEMLGILYFYFDMDASTAKDIDGGDIKCEEIDIKNFVVSDYSIKDIQKQEYVISRLYISVDRAKNLYKRNFGDSKTALKKIEECIETSEQGTKVDDRVIPVFIKFWRIKGEVYTQTACQNVELTKPQPLNIDVKVKELEKLERKNDDQSVEEIMNEYETDPSQEAIANEGEESESEDKFSLYPFSLYVYKSRKNSIVGLSEMEMLISAQKAINYYTSLVVKNGFDVASPVTLIEPNTLNGQILTNAPSQQIVDYSNTRLQGIRYLQVDPSLVNNNLSFVSGLSEIIRQANSSSNLMMGNLGNLELSSETVNTLISQAQAPLDEPINNLRRFDESCARIIAMFARFYYTSKNFSYKRKATEYSENLMQKYQIAADIDGQEIEKVQSTMYSTFNGGDYKGIDIGVVVKATQANDNYANNLLSTIRTFLMNGDFLNLSPELQLATIDALPDEAMDYDAKRDFINAIVRTQTGKYSQLQQQLQQAGQQVQQIQMAMQQIEQKYRQSEDEKKTLTNVFKTKYEEQTKTLEEAYKQLETLSQENRKFREALSQIATKVAAEQQKRANSVQQPFSNIDPTSPS